jgi:uncharacterized protein (DUF983 family)
MNREGQITKFVPRKTIKLGTPFAAGPVCTCPKCKTAFRAKSRKEAECPFCGYALGK